MAHRHAAVTSAPALDSLAAACLYSLCSKNRRYPLPAEYADLVSAFGQPKIMRRTKSAECLERADVGERPMSCCDLSSGVKKWTKA
jgi:hypothetical protein